MYKVVIRLKSIILQSNTEIIDQPVESNNYEIHSNNLTGNIGNINVNTTRLPHGDMSKLIRNFDKMKTSEVYGPSASIFSRQVNNNTLISGKGFNEPANSRNILPEKVSSRLLSNKVIEDVVVYISEMIKKGKDKKLRKQYILDYFDKKNLNSQEICNFLLRNQNDDNNPDFAFLLGLFNFYGIVMDKNYEKAFDFFNIASGLKHILAQYYVGECYLEGLGTIKNGNLAFEYYSKVKYIIGQTSV